MKHAEKLLGYSICWGLTAILAVINIAYLKTLGDVEIFGGHEVTRNIMIGASVIVDAGLIWSTARVLRHFTSGDTGRAIAAAAFWVICAGISGHSAYSTLSMLGKASASKTEVSADVRADKRDDLARAKNNLASIQAELRKAPGKRRSRELRTQEAGAEANISSLEKEVSELPVFASSAPVKGFEIYVAAVVIALPVLAMIAMSNGREISRPSGDMKPMKVDSEADIGTGECPPPSPPEKPSGRRKSPADKGGGHRTKMSTKKNHKNNVLPFKSPLRSEVDKLLSDGWTKKAIAAHFGVSTKTIQRVLKGDILVAIRRP